MEPYRFVSFGCNARLGIHKAPTISCKVLPGTSYGSKLEHNVRGFKGFGWNLAIIWKFIANTFQYLRRLGDLRVEKINLLFLFIPEHAARVGSKTTKTTFYIGVREAWLGWRGKTDS